MTRAGHEIVDFENRYRARGGDWRWLRWSARSDGDAWFAVAFDVTERKETEQRLRGLLTDEHPAGLQPADPRPRGVARPRRRSCWSACAPPRASADVISRRRSSCPRSSAAG